MLARGVDDLQVHAFVSQRELKVPDERIVDGDAPWKQDLANRVDTSIDGATDNRWGLQGTNLQGEPLD